MLDETFEMNRELSSAVRAWLAGKGVRLGGRFLLGLAIAVAVAVVAAEVDYRLEWERRMSSVARELEATSDLKVQAIDWWRWERTSDGLGIRSVAPVEGAQVGELLATGLEGEARRRAVRGWMGSYLRLGRYRSVRLLDGGGQLVMAEPAEAPPVSVEELAVVREAIVGRETVLRDLAWSGTGAGELPAVVMAVPVGKAADGGPGGVVLLQCDAPEFMKSLLVLWPRPAVKGRTLLARPGETSTQVLGASGGACVSLEVGGLPGEGAGLRWMGPGGEPVRVVRSAIRGMGWELLTQVPERAILRLLRRRWLGVFLGVMAWVLTLEAAWALVGRRRELALMAREVALERERKAMVERREMLNRSLIEHLPQRIFIKDRSMAYLACNENHARALGLRSEAVLGNTDEMLLGKHAAERGLREDQQVLAGERALESEDLVTTEAGARWLHVLKVPYRDASGQVAGVLGIVEDITRRKEMEQALRASEEKHRYFFEQMLDGFALHEILCDPTGRAVDFRFLEVNPAFEVLTGLKAALVVGRTAQDVLPGLDPELIRRYGEVALSGKSDHFEHYSGPLRRHFEVMAFCPRRGQFACTFIDISGRKRAEEAVQASLKEKEALLKEVHHRVKNNLQIVSSLLHLQSAQLDDPRAAEAFRSTEDRVRSMGLLHETLYRSGNLATADLPAYLASLCSQLGRSFGVQGGRIELVRRVEPLDLDLDLALPCGLIVTELVANALRHGFPEGRKGRVLVELRQTVPGRILVRVADDGVGFPAGLDPDRVQSLGMQLVRGLASQLGGEAAWESGVGVACRVEFPCATAGAGGAGVRGAVSNPGGVA